MKLVEEELQKTPETIKVNKMLEGSTGFLSEEVNPLYVQLSQDYVTKATQVSEMKAKINAMTTITMEIQQDVNSIQRDLVDRKDQRERLEAQKARLMDARNLLAEKVTQTQIAKSIDLGDTSIAVVSPAMVPSSPVSPNKELNMAIAFILGLMMAVMAVFIMEYLDNTIKNPREVADKLNMPLLGAIPYLVNKKS